MPSTKTLMWMVAGGVVGAWLYDQYVRDLVT